MKVIGNLWFPDAARKQGMKQSAKGAKYAHLSLSVGNKVIVRDEAGQPVLDSLGQPKTTWDNTYYSLTLFGAMAERAMTLLEAAKAQGRNYVSLEVSGEHTQSLYKKGNGETGISNNLRVISMRTPGEVLWTTTKGGELIQRALN
ncbi:hypothetical protein [Deinococcus kurensis]|uniref:hypothetical protein n=1 Tax=Deinococcus kurensis TaxID=2662757 RepID=UPI0012D36C4C|nr:hypothetical protein [Deinococcus kurensis]